jgi:DNA-binding MarR family transcriptional regulator
MKHMLESQVRHIHTLIDLAITAEYSGVERDYRSRFTPVICALLANEPSTVGQIAQATGMSQPAVTQTLNLMIKNSYITFGSNPEDARKRMVHLSNKARTIIPKLECCLLAIEAATKRLNEEMPLPLTDALEMAINALTTKPFSTRIFEARAALWECG